MDRKEVRRLLNEKYKIADDVIILSQNINGDTSNEIIQKRDIYENYNGQENFFFLNFDINDKLMEIELHHGFSIGIDGVDIDFSMDIEKVSELLMSISTDRKQLSDGEYLFEKLKLTVSSDRAMGGEGTELAYVYCSRDISHLVDEDICS